MRVPLPGPICDRPYGTVNVLPMTSIIPYISLTEQGAAHIARKTWRRWLSARRGVSQRQSPTVACNLSTRLSLSPSPCVFSGACARRAPHPPLSRLGKKRGLAVSPLFREPGQQLCRSATLTDVSVRVSHATPMTVPHSSRGPEKNNISPRRNVFFSPPSARGQAPRLRFPRNASSPLRVALARTTPQRIARLYLWCGRCGIFVVPPLPPSTFPKVGKS